MSISIDTEKEFDQRQHLFLKKKGKKEQNFLNLIKFIFENQ